MKGCGEEFWVVKGLSKIKCGSWRISPDSKKGIKDYYCDKCRHELEPKEESA